MTPQQRWRTIQARLPVFSLWQKIGLGGLLVGFLGGFILVVLPFLLPLGGLPEKNLADLQDADGAWLDIGEENLYFRHQNGDSETVILIHGFGWSSVDWGNLLPQLTPYDVYAIDLMGMGLSGKNLEMDLSHQAQAERLAQFIELQNLGTVHLVGHDMGGNIAVHLAQSHPEVVQTLTLIAPALQYEPTAQLPAMLYEWPFLKRWSQVLLRGIMPETTEINFRSAAFQDEFVTPELVSLSQRSYQTSDWDLALLGMARDIQNSDLEKPLSSLNMPTLIIWGAEDRWLAPQIAIELENEIPNAERVILDNVGHLPMLEDPTNLSQVLQGFWADQDRLTP